MLLNKKVFAVSILTSIISSNTNAAGFALIENGASGLGNAYAGASAVAEDSSTIYFNPAGLSKIKGKNYLIVGHILSSNNEFTNNGSTAITTAPLSGGNGGNSVGTSFVPSFFYSRTLNDKWSFGLGVTVPFGNSVEYDPDWVGRYQGIKTEISTLNINPSASYKVSDKFSVGFGVSVQQIDATLSNKLDSAAICNGAPFSAFCAGAGLDPTQIGNAALDSSQTLTGDSWDFGWNVGLLYDISEQTRLGVSYRSKVDHGVKGNVDFTVNANLQAILNALPAPSNNLFTDTGITTRLILPETLSLSLSHNIDSKWKILADATWTKWERYKELVVDFDNPVQSNSTLTPNYQSQWRYSLGASYKADAKTTYRMGVALDETAIRSATARTVRSPGTDKLWLSFGYGRELSDGLSFDIGYTHIFISDPSIENSHAAFGTVKGTFEQSSDILSAQFNWKF